MNSEISESLTTWVTLKTFEAREQFNAPHLSWLQNLWKNEFKEMVN